MKRQVLFAAVAVVILQGADAAAAAELPAYESVGLPITAHEISVLGSNHVQEVSPASTLTVGGMPASPHQISVLTPRKKVVGELAKKPTAAGGGVIR
jgi:hypothetical protein